MKFVLAVNISYTFHHDCVFTIHILKYTLLTQWSCGLVVVSLFDCKLHYGITNTNSDSRLGLTLILSARGPAFESRQDPIFYLFLTLSQTK